jgi:hypothetical protein
VLTCLAVANAKEERPTLNAIVAAALGRRVCCELLTTRQSEAATATTGRTLGPKMDRLGRAK